MLLKKEVITMKKGIFTVLLTLAVLMLAAAPAAYAGNLLDSKAVYYTEESIHRSG